MSKLLIISSLWITSVIAMSNDEIHELFDLHCNPGNEQVFTQTVDYPVLPDYEDQNIAALAQSIISKQRNPFYSQPTVDVDLSNETKRAKGIKPDNKSICRICKKKYRTANDLTIHYAQQHPDQEIFFCNVCQHPYINIGSLKNHRYVKHRHKS